MKKLFFLFMIIALAFTSVLCPGKRDGEDATQGDAVEEGAHESEAPEAPSEGGQGNDGL